MLNYSKMKTSELLQAYNEAAADLGEKPVKRFSDRKSAIRRTKAIVERADAEFNDQIAKKADAVSKNASKPKPKSKAPAKGTKVGAERELIFDYPAKEGGPSRHRDGTKRAALIELLSRKTGASFEECMAATGWPRKTCNDGMRLLHHQVGYGMTTDSKGRIRIFS